MHLPHTHAHALPSPLPLSLPLELLLPLPLLGLFIALYALLAPRVPSEKQRAYLLSAVSSASMTLLSLPHVYYYLRYGLEEAFERAQHGWMGVGARVGVVGFGVYLFADLAVGYVMYPKQVGLLTGWIHHTVYIGVMIHLAQTRLGPMFLVAAIMELPTFDLAMSTLHPPLRSDERFLSLFLLLRILFHAYLLFDTARPRARAAMDGSAVPAAILALALVLHVSWFQAGVAGYLRRRRARGSSKIKEGAGADAGVNRVSARDQMEVGGSAAYDASALLKNAENDAAASTTATTAADALDIDIESDTAPSPADSPLVTPLTPRTPSALAYIPSGLNLPSLSLPPSLSLARLGDVGGFKDAVRARWEGQGQGQGKGHLHSQEAGQGGNQGHGTKGRARAFGLTWAAGAVGMRRRKGRASGAEMGEAQSHGESGGEGAGTVVKVVLAEAEADAGAIYGQSGDE